MIRKCVQQVIKTSTSPLFPRSGAAEYPSAFRFSQQKPNFNLKQDALEKEVNQKVSPLVSAATNSPQTQSFETFESENCAKITGRIHDFRGEQRPYFVVVAGILLLLNVAIRLTIPHEDHFHSYEKKGR